MTIDKNTKIWITHGNCVSFGKEYITSFKTFTEAWLFSRNLQNLIESSGLSCDIFTQGGIWLNDSEVQS